MNRKKLIYRPEIDGLRAIAVVSVLLFHLNKSWLPGGFIGVDIFFVISGFLITKLLVSDLETGTLSIPRFYQRRIARLAPMMIVVVAATVAAAFFVYSSLCQSALHCDCTKHSAVEAMTPNRKKL